SNYTNISVTDTVGIGNSYLLYWWPLITPVAATTTSFENTSMGIAFIGSPVIDTVRWHWTDAQLNSSGIPENKLSIWRSNGTVWSLVNNQALSTAANRITVTNLNTAGIYSILNYTAPVRPRRPTGGGGGGASRNSVYNQETTPTTTVVTNSVIPPVRDDILPEVEEIIQEEIAPVERIPEQRTFQQRIFAPENPSLYWFKILGLLVLLILIGAAIYLYKNRKS
ncbi:hypothetical protein KY315_03120, partial [Candidatus Woesearchaeota archaeon]|nr:hypothetical protein [Candidatus Woesearchaeota archaeon]